MSPDHFFVVIVVFAEVGWQPVVQGRIHLSDCSVCAAMHFTLSLLSLSLSLSLCARRGI